MLRSGTSKPVDQFAGCFAAEQEKEGRAWVFLPSSTGGTFINAATTAGSGDFWLRVSAQDARTRLQLIGDEAAAQAVLQAVNQCR